MPVAARAQRVRAPPFIEPAGYVRHRPETTQLPERPLRQWVLSLPYALRFLLATDPAALTAEAVHAAGAASLR